uniref:NADH-ubiquinone oxidoreductase chain 4 n=1 Tax=Eurythenes maldoror TaxID=1836943 RepID=A0A343RBC7_9CRUS|nr:NADH dehydrogenase subunit 4 [Eurythenes maldoror]ATX68770.1 NADH dehydrogenase subunit 4 [Eurythenes maldoror]
MFLSVSVGLVFGGFWGEVVSCVLGLGVLWVLSSSDLGLVKVAEVFELDSVGYSLGCLSLWVVLLSLLGSVKIKSYSSVSSMFMAVSVGLLGFLILSFSFSSFLLFYLSFESCLIPILLMILGWGYQPERAQAGIYMLMYTLFGSLPLFFMILSMGLDKGSSYMWWASSVSEGWVMSVFLVGAFLVKFPMYSVHLWLLKAHVEAPVAGSMLLAGVLLKLGGYGLIRVLPFISAGFVMKEVVVSLSLWGGVAVSLGCLRQMDMKLLVASSSVVHMGGCIGGLFVLSDVGYKGCVGMMVAHGLCSSGLFYIVNLVYERTHSRSMFISKGLLNLMPSMSLWWFLLVSVNMAAPPSINLLSEIMLIISLISWDFWCVVPLMLMSFFSAAYSLYLFSLSQHGVYLLSKGGFLGGSVEEYLVLFLHWAPLNLLIMSFYYVI